MALLPLDGRDCIVKRIEPLLDDIERVRIDELRPLVVDGRRPVIHLQMNGAELVVRTVSMQPTNRLRSGSTQLNR